jgi:hypothetical protein
MKVTLWRLFDPNEIERKIFLIAESARLDHGLDFKTKAMAHHCSKSERSRTVKSNHSSK